ncbi:NAD(P)H-dependent oxidoreductase [Staphylococcus sp. FSL K6-3157]|uniref:NAD(P)H-dependent oxidoreductase n=1 Tax=Staphylococcus sp. FSL K6-3157 TaxID=2921490 RepID=UPI0030F8F3C4
MSTLVVLVHPNIEESIINKNWRDALLSEGIDVHDLYLKYLDKDINVSDEQILLESYDNIIFQYPMYWYSSPPLLKKYLDEVLLYGWAYGSNGNALKGKNIGIAVSIGAESDKYDSEKYTRYSPETLLSPMIATINFIGANYIGLHKLYGALNISAEELEKSTMEYLLFVRKFENSGLFLNE